MQRPLIVGLSAIWVVAAFPALAQAIPEGQSCGGLLCDVGVFGHKVKAVPAPAPPPPKSDQTAAIAPVPVVTPEPEADQPHKADLPPDKAPMKKRVVRSVSSKVVRVKAKPVATKVRATPAAATPPAVAAPAGAPGGEARPSPADMFPPIYR